MRKVLLLLRLALEGLIGCALVINAPFSLMKSMHDGGTTAYMLGSLFGSGLVFVLAIFLIRDAFKIGKRFRTPMTPAETGPALSTD